MRSQRHHHLFDSFLLDAAKLPARVALVFGFRLEGHEARGVATAASCSHIQRRHPHDPIRRPARAGILFAREERHEHQLRSVGFIDTRQVQVADDPAALSRATGPSRIPHIPLLTCMSVHSFAAQAWKSDALKDDWEGYCLVSSAGQASPRTARLSGSGGIVDVIVASVLKGNLDLRPPCCVSECCDLNDDAALEVLDARALMLARSNTAEDFFRFV